MKKVTQLFIIAALCIDFANAQSTTLLPGFGEFKSDKVVIGGVSNSNQGKLQINGNSNGFGALINATGTSASSTNVGLQINSQNTNSLNIGAKINFGEALNNTGLTLTGTNLGNYGEGIQLSLSKNDNTGSIFGQKMYMQHNGSGDGYVSGISTIIAGTGTAYKEGYKVQVEGSGSKHGVISLIVGTDLNGTSSNRAGSFESHNSNAALNTGIYVSAQYAAVNRAIYAEAYGSNATAGYFVGLVHHHNYTKLGENAPKIQQKEIEIPDNLPTGDFTSINHGLGSMDRIVSLDLKILTSSGAYVHENYPSPYRFVYAYDNTNITIYNIPLESSGITGTGRKIKILITYKE